MRRALDPDRWTFNVVERSAAVREATADDNQGHTIVRCGGDPDVALEQCRREAAELTRRKREAAERQRATGPGEVFVRRLAKALPEAYVGVDLPDAYDFADDMTPRDRQRYPDDDGWATTIALADAMRWLETEALVVDRRRRSTTVPPGSVEALRRFFAYVEQAITDCEPDQRGWIMVELFEHVPWTEDVVEYLGPETVGLLRQAQQAPRRLQQPGWTVERITRTQRWGAQRRPPLCGD